MTKCIEIKTDCSTKNSNEKTPIEFKKSLDCNYEVFETDTEPNDFKFVELVCKNYSRGLDLMLAFDDSNNQGNGGVLYIGHWNDGIKQLERKKPIELNRILTADWEIEDDNASPNIYKYLELICKNYAQYDELNYFDLIFAYNDPNNRGRGTLYLGHWNDGVAE
jgi:hypothetical protein